MFITYTFQLVLSVWVLDGDPNKWIYSFNPSFLVAHIHKPFSVGRWISSTKLWTLGFIYFFLLHV